jgi:hypothetical protein
MATAGIVGSWRVSVQIPGVAQEIVNLATFSSDQTVVVAFATPSFAASGQNHRLEFFSTALGSWETQSDGSVVMTFVSLGADENGNTVGSHTISAEVTVATDNQSWSGPFRIDVASATGAPLGSVAGTTKATRIVAAPFAATA